MGPPCQSSGGVPLAASLVLWARQPRLRACTMPLKWPTCVRPMAEQASSEEWLVVARADAPAAIRAAAVSRPVAPATRIRPPDPCEGLFTVSSDVPPAPRTAEDRPQP